MSLFGSNHSKVSEKITRVISSWFYLSAVYRTIPTQPKLLVTTPFGVLFSLAISHKYGLRLPSLRSSYPGNVFVAFFFLLKQKFQRLFGFHSVLSSFDVSGSVYNERRVALDAKCWSQSESRYEIANTIKTE